MQFNTPIFLFLFLPIFVLVYQLAGTRGRLVTGVLGSLLFYAWGNLEYLPLLIALTLAAYGIGRLLEQREHPLRRQVILWAAVLATVAVLVAFKLLSDLPYPLGLSYLAFQALSYVFEVYRKRVEAEPDLLRFSFYLLLFPKIPVGPIVRYSTVKEQIGSLTTEPDQMAAGLRRFIRGLAKKVLIADTLAGTVNPIFRLNAPLIPPGWAWLILIAFALQLFFDFSGYTDMAIGLGRMLGLTFAENFNYPYLARSIGDFWRRWHITLSNWFRDFVFYPLERRRLKWIGQPLNTLIVFLLVGLWHGLGWTFVLWGLTHGLALVFESSRPGKWLTTRASPLSHVYTLVVILVGWVFFRSPSLPFAIGFFQRLGGYTAGVVPLPFGPTMPLPLIEPSFIVALTAAVILCFPVGQWLQGVRERYAAGTLAHEFATQAAYDLGMLALLVVCVAALASSTFTPGLYAKF